MASYALGETQTFAARRGPPKPKPVCRLPIEIPGRLGAYPFDVIVTALE
jgi:hypothetical protein